LIVTANAVIDELQLRDCRDPVQLVIVPSLKWIAVTEMTIPAIAAIDLVGGKLTGAPELTKVT
jgi:hypothetical protein